MRLILVRHGQTTSNVLGALDTATPGAELTELGHEQAAALPEALENERIDEIVVSTLVRTHQTAAALAAARGIEPIVRAGVREVEAGTLEMKSDRHSVMAYLTAFASWAQGDFDARMPGAENGTEAYDRFTAVVEEFAHVEHLLIVSHGAMIRYWTARAASNVDGLFARDHILSNTGIVVLNGSPTEGWVVESWLGLPVGGPEVTDLAGDGPTE